MSDALIWIHEDALGEHHPVCAGQSLKEHACFVWDEAHLQRMNYGFKRLVFIYETLCEMQVPIYRGDTLSVLSALASARGCESVCVAWTPNPGLQVLMEDLETRFEVERVFDTPFVELNAPPKLRSFSSYWKSARPKVMGAGQARQKLAPELERERGSAPWSEPAPFPHRPRSLSEFRRG